MREVAGKKVAFVEHEPYFSSFGTPSMYNTAKKTGADVVLLLAEGRTESDMSDDEVLELLVELGMTGRSEGDQEQVKCDD